MPVFEYTALNAKGRNKSGIIDAETPRDAREKLRHKKLYVTRIDEVRGTRTKREVVRDEKGERKVVLTTELPGVVRLCGSLAIVVAGVMLLQLVLDWRAQSDVVLVGQEAEGALTGVDIGVRVASAALTAWFGLVILGGRSWALSVTAIFAMIDFVGPFGALLSESDYLKGASSLAFGGLAALCVLAVAKMKDARQADLSELTELAAAARTAPREEPDRQTEVLQLIAARLDKLRLNYAASLGIELKTSAVPKSVAIPAEEAKVWASSV